MMVSSSAGENSVAKRWPSSSLMAMDGGTWAPALGLQSPVPVTDVRDCSVLNCSLSLLCDVLSSPSGSWSTTHSVGGHLQPSDAPSQTWSQGVWGLNAHSAPYSSKPWASCFSLWASVSSSEIPGSTPQNRENRIVTTIAETREGQWLPGVTLQESGKHSGVLASQPQTPSTPSSLPWSGVPGWGLHPAGGLVCITWQLVSLT